VLLYFVLFLFPRDFVQPRTSDLAVTAAQILSSPMKASANRKCLCYGDFCAPDRRNVRHQRYCSKPACRKEFRRRRVLSASEYRTLRLWDLESGQTIRTFEGHTGLLPAVALTPDGRRAVSVSSDDQTLRLWDLENGQTIRTLEGHTDWVPAVVLTPDGRRAVSVSSDRTLRLWDLESGKETATFTGDSEMSRCAVALDGRTIVAGESSGRVHFLQIVEADETKPPIGEAKIQFLHRKDQATDS
jgi:WD40 repeat protein